ncbi:MAG: ABC transporter permease [Candidatus Xenobiia bacterium LiM19]
MSHGERSLKNAVQITAAAVLLLPVAGVLLQLLSIHRLSEAAALWADSISGRQLGLLVNSVLFSGLVAMGATALGAMLALVFIQNRSGRHLLASLLVPLIIIPPAIHGLNWTLVAMTLNEWLSRNGFTAVQMSGWCTAGLIEILALLPIGIALAWAGFTTLDARLLEAGLLYRSPPAVLAEIAMKLAGPFLWAGAGVIFLLSLSDYSVPSLCSVNVYALEIYSTFSSGIHPAAAAFTAAPLIAVVVLTVIAGLRAGRRVQAMALALRAPCPSFETGMPVKAAAIIVMLMYLGLPLLIMVSMVGSLKYLAVAVSSARGEILVSCAVSFSAAVFCLLFGLAVGRAMERGGPVSSIWWILTCLSFALPAPLIGIGILQISGLLGSRFEDMLPVWAGTARFLPVAAFISYALYRRSDESLVEAARIFGRSHFHILTGVKMPLILPGLVITAATCFSFTMGELGATLLVASPGRATLMMRLYNLLHYGASRDVAALSLLLTLPVLVAGILMIIFLKRRTTDTPGENDNA